MSHNIYELFATKFADSLDSPFLTVPTDDGVVTYTYGQIDQRSADIAAVLTGAGANPGDRVGAGANPGDRVGAGANPGDRVGAGANPGDRVGAGANPGDRVVVQVDKSADAVALYLACLRAGLIFVPLNTAYTPEEVGFFLGDANPAAFVYKPNRAPKLQPVADIADVPATFTLNSKGGGSLAEAADAVAGTVGAPVAREADDVACMVYTSGTTGRSKGAMLTNRGIAANGRALHAIWRFQPDDVLLHILPIFHIHGLFVALHCAMLNRSEVLFHPRFEIDRVRADLGRSTVMMGVPTHYSRLLAEPEFGSADCANVRLFTCGSAPLPEPVFHEFIGRTGHTITERYGMTETGIIASNPPEGPRIAGTVGFALPEMETRVADEKDEPLEAGEIGEVQVRGPHLFAGYWGLENKTAESFTGDGFFKTGDVGSMAADGRLTLAGRSNDMIISGGYNVYPKEVELFLDLLPGVDETAVIGLPHDDFGEAVTAFVVGDGSVDEESLRTELAEAVDGGLANFKRPKQYLFVDELPRNSMGKVQKAGLRDTHAELYTEADL